jgi:sigma-E factor negative regulatory protein RseC
MIEQQGLVVAVSGDFASVRLGGKSTCAACNAGKGCGAGIFGRLLKRKPVLLELQNGPGARVGQPVMVGLSETLFLRLVFNFYLFPLLAGLAGAAIGHYVSVKLQVDSAASDGMALLGAVLGGALALMWNRQGNNKPPGEFQRKITVHLLRVVEVRIAEHCDTGKPANRF